MEQAYWAYRKTIRSHARVFRESQKGLLAPTRAQRNFLHKMGLLATSQTSPERWFDSFGQICGVADLSMLRQHQLPVPARGNLPCLVVPVCVVPGYAHRLHLITENMSWDLSAAVAAEPAMHESAPAFAGMQILHKLDAHWFIGTTMLDVMLRAQARRLSVDHDPLPMFGWSSNETAVGLPSLSMLQNRPVVLWERVMTPQVLHFATLLGAKIAIGIPTRADRGPVSRSEMMEFVTKTSPYRICDAVRRHAVVPKTALQKWWSKADSAERLRLYDACRHFSDITSEHITHITHVPPGSTRRWQTVRVGKMQYNIHGNRLLDTDGNLVSPYTLHIRRILWVRDNVYCLLGTVRSPDHVSTIRFHARFVRAWQILHADKLITSLAKHGFENGAFKTMPPKQLLRTLLYVSLRLHKPKIEPGMQRTGWVKNQFLLPNHRVTPYLHFRRHLLLKSAPGPQRLPEHLVFPICDGYAENVRKLYWSMLYAMCTQATALRAGWPVGGIRLSDVGVDTLQALASTLDLRGVPKTGFWRHDWPYFYAGENMEAKSGRVSMYVTDCETEFSLATSFCVVRGQGARLSPKLCYDMSAAIVHYLAWLTRHKPKVESWSECAGIVRRRFEQICPGSSEYVTGCKLVSM